MNFTEICIATITDIIAAKALHKNQRSFAEWKKAVIKDKEIRPFYKVETITIVFILYFSTSIIFLPNRPKLYSKMKLGKRSRANS